MSYPGARGRLVSLLQKYGRWLLLGFGAIAVVFLIRESGPEQVLEVMVRAAPWLPLIFLLEVAWISMDAVGLRFLLREHGGERIPWRVWIRSATVAYGVMVLLPAGRAGGEVMRAAQLSRYVGLHAATAAAQLQGVTLLANTVISVPCWIAVVSGVGVFHSLAWLLVLNGLATGALGTGMLFLSSRSALGAKLARWLPFVQPYAEALDAAQPARMWPGWALWWTSLGRIIQALQYGIILLAIGGQLTVPSAFVAQGIHLVGAGMGEMVPNAVGITETFYRVFAPVLGLSDDFARAIAIALVARLTQYTIAAMALLSGTGGGRSEAEEQKISTLAEGD
ncbi:MAG: flippase-like domain-containing protein [Myxococcales bacterium]|nr:flippase-like domain-containing protein [Myxococcales bacterium]